MKYCTFILILLLTLLFTSDQTEASPTTLAGYVRTNASESLNATFSPAWVRVGFDASLTEDLDYGSTVWIIDTSSVDSEFALTSEHVADIVEADNDAFIHKYFVGNEPYLSQSPSSFIDDALEVMDIVLAGDPEAEFIFPAGVNSTSGSYGSPIWYEEDSWHDVVWTSMSSHSYYKQKVTGFAIHAYPDSLGIIDWFRNSDEYRDDRFPLRDIIVSEVGRPSSSGATQYNPTNVYNKAALYDMWGIAWYCLEGCSGYMNLYNSGVTSYGQEFINLQ